MVKKEGFRENSISGCGSLLYGCPPLRERWEDTSLLLGCQRLRYSLIDLRASDIAFIAHDLRRRTERRSPYDLVVLRRLGDIKSTTYFLYSARTLSLNCDFYITRLYHPRRRRYLWIVVMTEATWRALNGEVATATLETAAGFFPRPVQIMLGDRRFVIAPFDLWKEKVKQRQQEEG